VHCIFKICDLMATVLIIFFLRSSWPNLVQLKRVLIFSTWLVMFLAPLALVYTTDFCSFAKVHPHHDRLIVTVVPTTCITVGLCINNSTVLWQTWTYFFCCTLSYAFIPDRPMHSTLAWQLKFTFRSFRSGETPFHLGKSGHVPLTSRTSFPIK